MQQHHAPEKNSVDKITVLVEICRRQPQSCEGLCDLQEKGLVAKGEECNNITPLEENECLVVDEGFPIDEVTVPVKILRRQPQSCEGLCDLQEKRLVTKGER